MEATQQKNLELLSMVWSVERFLLFFYHHHLSPIIFQDFSSFDYTWNEQKYRKIVRWRLRNNLTVKIFSKY